MSPGKPAHAGGSSSVPRLILLLILAVSAFIQLTVVSRTRVDVPLRADSGEYLSYAFNLRNFGIYSITPTWADEATGPPTPDAFRPPGYPLFLALVGQPEPLNWYLRRVAFIQAGLGVFSVWLTFCIARRLAGPRWALAAALLTAIAPHLAIISTLLLSESLFFFLLLASVSSLLLAVAGQRRWPYVLTGLLWGLCSLVRPTTEFFPPLLLLLVLVLPKLRAFRASALLAFACFAAVMAPWLIRNASDTVSKPPSSLMVKALAHGSYPGFMYEDKPESFGFPYRFDPDSEKNARNLPSILRHIVGRFRAQPGKYLQWYLLGKPVFFLGWSNVQGGDILIHPVLYTPYYEDINFWRIRQAAWFLHWPLMVLGVIGAGLLLLWPASLGLDAQATIAGRLVAALVLYAIAFHMIVAPFPRYGIPFWALLHALAMLPLRAIWLARRNRHPVHLY